MAIGDYILCCKCECKLIYDGDRVQREWWNDRWGTEPLIECPDCKQSGWQGLTDEEAMQIINTARHGSTSGFGFMRVARAIEAALKARNA